MSRVLSLTVLALLVGAALSQAQPSHPQGNGSVSGGSSSFSRGYVAPTNTAPAYTAPAADGSYQSFYPPEAERTGWEFGNDGWLRYWRNNRLIGAYDRDSNAWYRYNDGTWSDPLTPPWQRNR